MFRDFQPGRDFWSFLEGPLLGIRLPLKRGQNPQNREKSIGIAKPFSPYSIQKRPEPQICPKFVPAIVFGGSSPGVKNLKKFVKICLKIAVFQILTIFFQIFDPLTGTPKNNRWDKFWTNLGFGAFLNAVRGKRFRNIGIKKPQFPATPEKGVPSQKIRAVYGNGAFLTQSALF